MASNYKMVNTLRIASVYYEVDLSTRADNF